MSNTATTHPTIPATDELIDAYEQAFASLLPSHQVDDTWIVCMDDLTEAERTFCAAFAHGFGHDEPRPHLATEVSDPPIPGGQGYWVTEVRSECLSPQDARIAVRLAAEALETLDHHDTGTVFVRPEAVDLEGLEGLFGTRTRVRVSRERIPTRHAIIDPGVFGVRDLVVAIYGDEETGPYWRVFVKPAR